MPPTPPYRGRWLVRSSFVLAGLSAALVVGWLVLATDRVLMCDLGEASSRWGDAERTWLPPGTTCTWWLDGTPHTDRPDASRLAVLAMALFGVPLGLYLRGLLRPAPQGAR